MDKFYFCNLLKRYYLCFNPKAETNKWTFNACPASKEIAAWTLEPNALDDFENAHLLKIPVPHDIDGVEIENWLSGILRELLDTVEKGYICGSTEDDNGTFTDKAKEAIDALEQIFDLENDTLPRVEWGGIWAEEFFQKHNISWFLTDLPSDVITEDQCNALINEIERYAHSLGYCINGLKPYVHNELKRWYGGQKDD